MSKPFIGPLNIASRAHDLCKSSQGLCVSLLSWSLLSIKYIYQGQRSVITNPDSKGGVQSPLPKFTSDKGQFSCPKSFRFPIFVFKIPKYILSTKKHPIMKLYIYGIIASWAHNLCKFNFWFVSLTHPSLVLNQTQSSTKYQSLGLTLLNARSSLFSSWKNKNRIFELTVKDFLFLKVFIKVPEIICWVRWDSQLTERLRGWKFIWIKH